MMEQEIVQKEYSTRNEGSRMNEASVPSQALLKSVYEALLFYASMDSYNNKSERIENDASGNPQYKMTAAPIMLDDGQRARQLLPRIRDELAKGEHGA